ncbi:MAG: TfoX/Sxy family protein [Parvularculaceae bacterium]|nr:TfoX/Sxy family protein [Parvularculaceae bacterium]
MAVSATFIEQAKDLFHPFGAIRVKKMFGGAGVYCDDLFFAILDDGAVYFKVDDETRKEFERRGLSQFSFEMKDGASATMSYYTAPEEIFDDEDELRHWTTLALDAARRAAKFKKKKQQRA